MSCSFDITKDILQFYNKPYDERELEENEIMKDDNVEGIGEAKLNELYNKLLLINGSNKKHESDDDDEDNEDNDDNDDPVNNILKILINEMKNKKTANVLAGGDGSIQSISNINFIEDKEFVKKILLYRFLEIQKKILYIETDIVLYNYIIACILNNENKLKKLQDGDDNHLKLNKNKTKLTNYKDDIYKKLQFYLKDDIIKTILTDNICTYKFLNKQYGERISNIP